MCSSVTEISNLILGICWSQFSNPNVTVAAIIAEIILAFTSTFSVLGIFLISHILSFWHSYHLLLMCLPLGSCLLLRYLDDWLVLVCLFGWRSSTWSSPIFVHDFLENLPSAVIRFYAHILSKYSASLMLFPPMQFWTCVLAHIILSPDSYDAWSFHTVVKQVIVRQFDSVIRLRGILIIYTVANFFS